MQENYTRWHPDHHRFEWVEGRIHASNFGAARGKEYSALEVKRNLERLLGQVGAVEVFNGRIPADRVRALGSEVTVNYVDGLGDVYNDPASTYLLRRDDGDVWLLARQLAMGGKDPRGGKRCPGLLPALLVRVDERDHLSDGSPARAYPRSDVLAEALGTLITAKPTLYVANVDEESLLGGNGYSSDVDKLAAREGAGVVRISARLEAEVAAVTDETEAIDRVGRIAAIAIGAAAPVVIQQGLTNATFAGPVNLGLLILSLFAAVTGGTALFAGGKSAASPPTQQQSSVTG
jgi:hypothetical protein